MIKMKKVVSCILAAVMLMPAAVMPTYAAAEYTVEGEGYADTNWWYAGGKRTMSKTDASGGKYLALKMDSSGPDGLYAEYNVTVSAAGYYKLTLTSTPVTKTGWTSPMYISVNGGSDIALSGAKLTTEAVSGTGIYTCDSDVLYLKSGENTIRFIVKDKNDDGKYSASIDKFKLTASASYSIDGIYSAAPYMVFESGSPVNLYVQGTGISGTAQQMSYTVKTYRGTSVKSGSVTIPAGGKRGDISLTGLDKGSYKISVTYSGKTYENYFSVVAPESARTEFEETAFALDTNLISLYNKYTNNKNYVENYAKALRLMGVSWIRDRISMSSAISKNGDAITANTSATNYIGKKIRENSNVKITAVINDLPSWMLSSGGKTLECDPVDVYKAFKALGDALGDNVDAIEILNETDTGGMYSGSDSPDLYAAIFKAAAAGINDSVCDAVVISQGASAVKALDYIDTLYKNEVFEQSVVDNYHFHSNYTSGDSRAYVAFPGIGSLNHIKAMQRHNGDIKPIWITEAGLLIECGSDTELSAAQQYAQAKYLITSAVESIASGADKNFYFLGTEYQENENTTGIMTKNDNYPSFYAAFAAMSAMTEMLGSGEYVGNINTGNIRGYVFNNGTNDVIAAYSVSGSRSLNISGSYTKYDMFGNLLSGTSGSVTVSEEPVFIVMNGGVTGINTDNAHAPKNIIPVASTVGDHIVIRQDYSDNASTGARNGSYFIDSNDNTVTVTVSNLNGEAVSGALVPDCDADWTFSPETRNISLGAYESGEYTFTINFSDSETKEAVVSFKAVCGNIESSISAAKVKSGSDEYLKNAKRYWIDATKYSAKTGAYTQKQDSSAINGSAMRLLTQNYEQPLVRSTLTYDFSIPAGTYDVWMLMSDPNVNHMTKWKWRYELPDEYRRYTGSGTVAYEFGNQHKMYWYKVSSGKTLSKGKHSIIILSDALRGGTYNDYMLQIADSIVIVPTSDTWWDPRNKSNGENVIAFESRNFASSFSFTNLREDVELPSKTSTGADVVWASSDSGVIDANGHIQQGTETKSATLTATLTCGSSSTAIDFPVTVAGVSDLTVTVTPVDENGNDITRFYSDHNNYLHISAVNPLSEDKSATVYIAGYEKRMNRFVFCDKKEIVAKSGETAAQENILIEDDPSVSYYKIFVWNNMLQPLQDYLTLRTSSGSDYNDAWITISGNCGNPNETLTLTVAKDTGRKLSSMSKSEVKDSICYIGDVTSDSKGNYTLRCKLTEAEGKYKINIKHSAGSEISEILVK